MQIDLEIIGSNRANILTGGTGDDTLNGGRGRDELEGWGGADRLEGGRGNDLLSGGGGRDRFVFSDNWGSDVITDFRKRGEVLVISGEDEAQSLRQFKRASVQDGDDIRYDAGMDGQNVIVLENFDLSDLRRNDFEFG